MGNSRVAKMFMQETNKLFLSHMLALVFCIMGILVLNASMLGFVGTKYESIRSIVTNGAMGIYAVYLCYEVAKFIIKNIRNIAKIILICAVPLISVAMAVYSLITYNFEMISNTIEMLIFMNTAYVAGVLTIEYKLLNKVFEALENLTLLYIPYAIFYTIALVKAGGYNGAEFYGLTYLSISMYYLVPIAVMSINFIYNKNHKLYGVIPAKISNLLRLFLCAVYIYALIFANGARGPVLSLAFFYFVVLLFAILRKMETKRNVIALSMAVFSVAAFLIFPSNSRLFARIDIIIENFLEGNGFVTSSSVTEYVDKDPDPAPDIEIPDNVIPDDVETPEDVIIDGVWNLSNRGDLFKLAVKNGTDEPFSGMGVFGFTYKYGVYPHNAVLELIADFGIVFGGIAVLIIFALILKLFFSTKNKSDLIKPVLYMSPFVMLAMSSGTVYENVVLYFGMGLALAYIIINKNNKNELSE